MNKLQMAHEYFLRIVSNPSVTLRAEDLQNIQDNAWIYADAMQAEADKREKEESEKKRADIREMLKANNTFVEREGQHFDDVEWQPDWSQAPDWANWWVMTKGGFFAWVDSEPRLSNPHGGWLMSRGKTAAPSFDYQGNWQDSLRKRPQ